MTPTDKLLKEMAEKILKYINGEFGVNPSDTGAQTNTEYIESALRQAHDFGLERAAEHIQDWHVPKRGGTHQMAFEIRALKLSKPEVK